MKDNLNINEFNFQINTFRQHERYEWLTTCSQIPLNIFFDSSHFTCLLPSSNDYILINYKLINSFDQQITNRIIEEIDFSDSDMNEINISSPQKIKTLTDLTPMTKISSMTELTSMIKTTNKTDLQSKDKSMNDSISMKETISMTELKRLRDKL